MNPPSTQPTAYVSARVHSRFLAGGCGSQITGAACS
jgi:hypothetical protein